ncbi:hypothetical protein AWB80_04092 [Caballeronia pedi]|uniref:Uncharacterized protein n=1 Tax=Caballeronia pedi TaxID=1777141 RepID=A0A158BTR3_9BURK|nr:hypothetical protein AWB80_04092 [Caballeronia pedi]
MSTFHHVLGLWLAPDFSAVERGETLPPHLDHDAIDPRGIADWLAEFNDCGEDVTIRVPNDAVDQVTVQFRLMGRSSGSPQCEDLRPNCCTSFKPRPIWTCAGLGLSCTRCLIGRKAPPPVLLMFVVSGALDAVMVWSQQFRMRLGIRDADILKQIFGNVEDADHPRQTAERTCKVPWPHFRYPVQARVCRHWAREFTGAVLIGAASHRKARYTRASVHIGKIAERTVLHRSFNVSAPMPVCTFRQNGKQAGSNVAYRQASHGYSPGAPCRACKSSGLRMRPLARPRSTSKRGSRR